MCENTHSYRIQPVWEEVEKMKAFGSRTPFLWIDKVIEGLSEKIQTYL